MLTIKLRSLSRRFVSYKDNFQRREWKKLSKLVPTDAQRLIFLGRL